MEPGQYEVAWKSFSQRMYPDKYVKFTQCFQRLVDGTTVKEATSMLTVGIGRCLIRVFFFETR